MSTHTPNPEDDRLLSRMQVVAVGVILALLTAIVVGVLFGPPLDEGEGAILIVVVPSLIGALVPLVGIKTIINRGD